MDREIVFLSACEEVLVRKHLNLFSIFKFPIMRLLKKKSFAIIHVLIFALIGIAVSCKQVKAQSRETPSEKVDSTLVMNNSHNIEYRIFGVDAKTDEQSVLKALEKNGIIKVDSMCVSEDNFQFALIEFAGIKFRVNKWLVFMTSQQDAKTINSLVKEISKYYGKPYIDGNEDEDPEWCYYHWNLYKEKPNDPYIRVRPLHSEDGGLTMLWQF